MSQKDPQVSLRCKRRTFFKVMLQEFVVARGALKGKLGYRLTEIGTLPDEQLAQIKPIVNPACEIFVDAGYVWARFKQADKVYRLFSTEQKNLTVFNMFNGRNTLETISQRLAQDPAWEEASAFAHVKTLFVSLVNRLVCLPENPLDT